MALRKTEGPRVLETTTQLCSNSDEYTKLMEDTYMEKYLDMIQPFSFGSELCPLPKEAARALVAARDAWLESKEGGCSSKELVLSSPEIMALAAAIDAIKEEQGYVLTFVRLSSRSPKDGALNNPRFQGIYEEELGVLREEQKAGDSSVNDDDELNLKLHALYRASTWCLASEDGVRACQLFVEADRTYDDLKAYAEGKITTDFNLVVREFRTFPVELEFRGFVHNRKLTALTQYNEFCHFSVLSSLYKDIVARIQKDFDGFMQKIPLDSYVVDFVLATAKEDQSDENKRLLLPLSDYKVWIIELNPLAEFAGAGLFDWLVDKPVLLGQSPFEFRHHANPPPRSLVLANMTPSWKTRIGV